MTTYNASAVDNSVIAYEKGITLQQGRALRDNPIAMIEGASGAPLMQAAWHPYDGVTVGDGATGLIYDFAVSGAVGSVTTPTFADGYEYMVVYDDLPTAIALDFQAQLYKATSASYTPVAPLFTGDAILPTITSGVVEILMPRSVKSSHFANGLITSQASGGNIIRAPTSPAQKVDNVKFSWSAGNFTGGKLYMLRRRTFA